MMHSRGGRGRAWLAAAGVAVLAGFASGEAAAQSPFCPTNPGVPNGGVGAPFALNSGRCTNGNGGTGAFSGAALGSQSLSDLASGSTESTNRAASGIINERRQAAQNSCPAGTFRSGSQCLPVRQQAGADSQIPSRTRVPASVRARSEAPRTETRLVKRGNKMVRVRVPVVVGNDYATVPAFVQAELAPRWGVFAQGFGDYEERNGRSASLLTYRLPLAQTGDGLGVSINSPLQISTKSRSNAYGAIGGLDLTTRGILGPDDGLIIGVLGGYLENEVKISSQINSLPSFFGRDGAVPPILASFSRPLSNGGSSNLTARTSGGSAGVFTTYFNGPISLDGLYKADFLDLNERFSDNQAYSAVFDYNGGNPIPLTPQNALISGRGKTSLVNHTLIGNINYRIPLLGSFWIEPTVGVIARWTDYASSAAQLGLADGHLLRVQGGSRLGWDFDYAGVKITPIITGLVYSDVTVKGGFVDNLSGGFGATTSPIGVAGTSVINIRQQGLVRGQGILTLVADFGNGWSGFVQGDVRGGKDLFGAGGKGGIRYQW